MPDGDHVTDDYLRADLATATTDDLRATIVALQGALRESKMNAAHHRLQYEMLAQESNAALDRMVVEAQMTQCENQIIRNAEQAKVLAVPVPPVPAQEGMVSVQKDLYNRMVREIQLLSEANSALESEYEEQERIVERQENEIASLSDKLTLMRELVYERHRDGRDPAAAIRRLHQRDSLPRSLFSTPQRGHSARASAQPFAALLQASEIASQDAARSSGRGRKSHARKSFSLSHIPTTPRSARQQPTVYETPQSRRQALKVPATAPVPRMQSLHTPTVHKLSTLPSGSGTVRSPSEGTVSASDNNDDDIDSEADTEIIEQDDENQVNESRASLAASHILRSSQEDQTQRNSVKGSGMLPPANMSRDGYKQTKLFGAIRKANVDRDERRPAKRARMDDASAAIGLGIVGFRK